MIKISGEAQGTTYHITYFDSKNRNLQPEIDKILYNFDLSVSTYKPNSIISKINKNEKVKVNTYFTTCFKKAKEVWKETDGAFDPTVYPLSNAYGFGPGKKMKIEQSKIDSILQFVGFEKIELQGKKIIKKDPRVALDFNAFAQGYSVDVVSNFLKSKNIKSFLIEIGGEVYANGTKPDGNEWTVGIEKPIENKETTNPLEALVKLKNLAVSTSGNYRRFTVIDGVKYAHHIDPKTGFPTQNNLLSASVFYKDCITTDATATGILVLGLEKAKIFLKQHPEINAYLIYSDENGDYKIYQTPDTMQIIKETE
jgi:thiamine biosynthesis lipoprotein